MLVVLCSYYNRQGGVVGSLRSVLDALPEKAVLVVVDDASTDATRSEILVAVHGDERVDLLLEDTNRGLTKALLYAIDYIENKYPVEYLAIHGSGDRVLPEKLKSQLEFMSDNPQYAFVACRHTLHNQAGSAVYTSKFHGEVDFEAAGRHPAWTHGSVMFRYSQYKAARGYCSSMKFCQDWELYNRILKVGPGMVLEAPLYEKCVFQDGASFSPKKRVKQIKYALFIETLHQLKTSTEYFSLLSRLDSEGLDYLVRDKESELCKRSISSMTKLIVAGEFTMALQWRPIIKSFSPRMIGLSSRFSVLSLTAALCARSPLIGTAFSGLIRVVRRML